MRPRILCISLGSIGRRHLRNARALLPRAAIAVWRQRARADGVDDGTGGNVPEGADAVVSSLQQALDFMPDAVLVASPASAHVANARPFVQRKLPVFLEKPLAAGCADLGDFPGKTRRMCCWNTATSASACNWTSCSAWPIWPCRSSAAKARWWPTCSGKSCA